jgi:hypothetical protein
MTAGREQEPAPCPRPALNVAGRTVALGLRPSVLIALSRLIVRRHATQTLATTTAALPFTAPQTTSEHVAAQPDVSRPASSCSTTSDGR